MTTEQGPSSDPDGLAYDAAAAMQTDPREADTAGAILADTDEAAEAAAVASTAAAASSPAAPAATRAAAAAPRTKLELRADYEALCEKQASGRSVAWAHLEPILLNDAGSGVPKEVSHCCSGPAAGLACHDSGLSCCVHCDIVMKPGKRADFQRKAKCHR